MNKLSAITDCWGINKKAAMKNIVQGSDTTRDERRSTAGQTKTFITKKQPGKNLDA
jgi:hypothetical protein